MYIRILLALFVHLIVTDGISSFKLQKLIIKSSLHLQSWNILFNLKIQLRDIIQLEYLPRNVYALSLFYV